jgi:lipopolysaccharide transport system permease protein
MTIIGQMNILYRYRELLWMWTVREIKIRYKQSVLGGAWAILQPFSLMVILSIVFTWFLEMPTEGVPYPIFSYTALLPWTFLATSISFATGSIVGSMNLVTKIYFPREIIPLSTVIASFIDFLVASIMFVAMILVYRIPFQITMLYLPLLLSIQIILTVGVVLFVSAINVFYRDFRFIVPLAIQLWFYATPVIYPVSVVPERFMGIYMLNPMASLIDAYRRVVLSGQPPQWNYLGISAVVSFAIFVFAYRYFKQVEWKFADLI